MGDIQRGEQTQKQIAAISPEYVEQKSGTVGTSKTTISFAQVTQDILFRNTHASNDLHLYFQSSEGVYNTHKLTLATKESVSIPLRTAAVKIEGSGANTSYEILATKE